MSWGFKFAARSKEAAKAKIDEVAAQPSCLPTGIASIMKAQIDTMMEPAEGSAILVESNGHVDLSKGYGYQNADAKSSITLIPLLVALFMLIVPALAHAEDAPAPRFGACWGTKCIGPRIAAPAMSVDLKTGDVQFNVIPGVGYGFEQVGGKVQWGVAGYVAVRDTAEGNRACPSIQFDLFQYVHAGALWQPGHRGGRMYGLLTLGTDLGVAPPAVQNAKPAQ